jgi:hypothetical protein
MSTEFWCGTLLENVLLDDREEAGKIRMKLDVSRMDYEDGRMPPALNDYVGMLNTIMLFFSSIQLSPFLLPETTISRRQNGSLQMYLHAVGPNH